MSKQSEKDFSLILTEREVEWVIDGLERARDEGTVRHEVYGVHQMLSERLKTMLTDRQFPLRSNANESARLDLL